MIPAFPGLVQDITNVIYPLLTGMTKYRMSMVSHEWHNYCIDATTPAANMIEVYTCIRRFNILEVLLYQTARYDTSALYVACSGGDIDLVDIVSRKRINSTIPTRDPQNVDSEWDVGMFGACKGGHVPIVKTMIKNGATQFVHGLQIACESGHFDVVELLSLKVRSDINWHTLLIGGCTGNNLDIIKLIIKRGGTDYDYAFNHACRVSNLDVIEFLINKGAKQIDIGLYAVCRHLRQDVIKFLLTKVNPATIHWDRALRDICRYGNVETAKLIVDAGNSYNCGHPINQIGTSTRCSYGCLHSINWNYGLDEACENGNIAMIKYMIANGANECYSCEGSMQNHLGQARPVNRPMRAMPTSFM